VTRSWKLATEKTTDISAYFSSVNYKKTYQQLNLSTANDRSELLSLLSNADIFISNFKKGDAEKFELTPEILHAINPRLIIGKITGFGDESDRVAYDLILQAETGYMSMNGTTASGPTKMPVALIDVLAAHHLKEGILIALYNRLQTNKGAVVSVSLYDAAIASLANQAANFLMAGHVPQRIGSLHPNIAPYGEYFICSDGGRLVLAIGNNKQFEALLEVLGLPDIGLDPKFSENPDRVKNRKELANKLQEACSRFTLDSLIKNLISSGVPAGSIKNLDDVLNDPSIAWLIEEASTEENQLLRTLKTSPIRFE
jgi:crotonobetainyl-CoA:carnitine CoA-transferase CaiB-like acyl-CoA transferase